MSMSSIGVSELILGKLINLSINQNKQLQAVIKVFQVIMFSGIGVVSRGQVRLMISTVL